MSLLAEAGPEPHATAYATQAGYLLAWHTWRAIRHDGRLTEAERAVAWAVTEAAIRRRQTAVDRA